MTPLAVASLAADAAAAAIRPYFRSARLGTERKDDESPVTIADREAERAIRAVIERHFPDDGILGEEFGLARPHARRRWLLDPIDGTRAFITGRPLFATLIALVEDGVPVLGVMDQPVTGERWTGARGEATRFEGPLGGTVGTRRCDALASAELSATSPAMFARRQPPLPSRASPTRRPASPGAATPTATDCSRSARSTSSARTTSNPGTGRHWCRSSKAPAAA